MKKLIYLFVALMTLVSCGGDNYDSVNDNSNDGSANFVHYIQGHGCVDLGLSVKWATCNVGAENCYDYGDFMSWGETIGYNSGKTDFSDKNYIFCKAILGKPYYSMTVSKYCTLSKFGTVDGKTTLDPTDDAATVNWGTNWRMATYEEWVEISDPTNCTWTWYDSTNTEFNGVAGYKVQSKKAGYIDNYIFLPAAGAFYSGGSDHGSLGNYFTSSLKEDNQICAWDLFFSYKEIEMRGYGRGCGHSIRPVTK